MSTVIFKYTVDTFAGRSRFYWNKGSRVLAFQMQDGVPTIWVQHPPSGVSESRDFAIMPTGVMADLGEAIYIGTVQDGSYVWHLYEVSE